MKNFSGGLDRGKETLKVVTYADIAPFEETRIKDINANYIKTIFGEESEN